MGDIKETSATGEIQWYRADGAEVGPDDEILGVVIGVDEKGKKIITDIINPLGKGAKGILIILPKAVPEVGIGNSIAVIRVTAILYASKVNR
jgi:hypothetical protein